MNPPDKSPSVAEVSNGYTEGASYEHQPCRPTDLMTAIPKQVEVGPEIEVAGTNTEEPYIMDCRVAATETLQQSAPGHTDSGHATGDSKAMHSGSHHNGPKSDAEELTALRQANAVLTQRLRGLEGENPEERKLKLKSDEVEKLKASVKQTHIETEIIKQTLAERQAYLQELNAQIAELQPPLPFAVRGPRKKKDKAKGRKET
jgi:hypothetical protein